MGTSTMRFHSQAPDLHNCNTKKQEKKLQPKRTHLLCNTQKSHQLEQQQLGIGFQLKTKLLPEVPPPTHSIQQPQLQKHTEVLINSR